MAKKARKGPSGFGGGTKMFFNFSFTQNERNAVIKYCSLREDIKKNFRKLSAAGAEIIVAFEKPEANEMMNSLANAVLEVSEDKDLKEMFDDLHGRFGLKYNEFFPY